MCECVWEAGVDYLRNVDCVSVRCLWFVCLCVCAWTKTAFLNMGCMYKCLHVSNSFIPLSRSFSYKYQIFNTEYLCPWSNGTQNGHYVHYMVPWILSWCAYVCLRRLCVCLCSMCVILCEKWLGSFNQGSYIHAGTYGLLWRSGVM